MTDPQDEEETEELIEEKIFNIISSQVSGPCYIHK